MTSEFAKESHKNKRRQALFKVFIFAVVEFTCVNLYYLISGLTGDFDWTIERLTTTTEGVVIQILALVGTIFGILIFLYLLVYIGLLITGPSSST